jgi:hypothetical protein
MAQGIGIATVGQSSVYTVITSSEEPTWPLRPFSLSFAPPSLDHALSSSPETPCIDDSFATGSKTSGVDYPSATSTPRIDNPLATGFTTSSGQPNEFSRDACQG